MADDSVAKCLFETESEHKTRTLWKTSPDFLLNRYDVQQLASASKHVYYCLGNLIGKMLKESPSLGLNFWYQMKDGSGWGVRTFFIEDPDEDIPEGEMCWCAVPMDSVKLS